MSYFILSLSVLLIIVADVYPQHSLFALVYDSPKWILLYAFTSLYLIYSIFRKKKIIVEYPSFIRLPLLFYVFGILLVLLTGPAGYRETVLAEHLLFLSLAFCFSWLLKEDKRLLDKLSIFSFVGLALMALAIFVSRVYLAKPLLPFFGSPAMYGEYLGALLVISSCFVLLTKNTRKVFLLKIAILLFGLAALFVIQSRAPLLGYLLALAILIYRNTTFIRIKKTFVYAALGVAVLWIIVLSQSGSKAESASIRKARWANTLAMIVENPLGVGLGNYAAAYGEYQNKRAIDVEADEHSIVGNPHNAYLELAAESGVIALLAFVALLVLAIRALSLEKSIHANLALSLILYWAVDAFFNFPQDCPGSFYFFSLTAGLLIFVCRDTTFEIEGFSSYALRGITILVLSVYSFRVFYSEVLTFHNMNNAKVLAQACKLDPQNWRACLRTVSLAWSRGNANEAVQVLEALELRFPENYIIRRKTIQLLFESGNKEKGCEELRVFDRRFNDASSMHKVLLEKCS